MKYWFHPAANDELGEAVAYYEACQVGLGQDFLAEVKATIDRIVALPQAWPALDGDVRRCMVHRFPFGVLYSVEPAGVFILALMHLRREPGYWKQRR